jgi:hypothetical protein
MTLTAPPGALAEQILTHKPAFGKHGLGPCLKSGHGRQRIDNYSDYNLKVVKATTSLDT